jgi:hypothetical protein
LDTAVKNNCDFRAADRWKVKGKQHIVGHGGCGGRQMHIAIQFSGCSVITPLSCNAKRFPEHQPLQTAGDRLNLMVLKDHLPLDSTPLFLL